MKIRIHETDFEGHPVECTGEYLSGRTALDIVNAMKMNPFNAHLEPLAFMRRTLDSIGQEKFPLPENAESAALFFIQRLAVLGFAKFEIDKGELDTEHPTPSEHGIENKSSKNAKNPE